MTPQQALLAEIHAHPDDDVPRLVYADLLQQQGDPYGEFIATQCARAHAPDDEVLEARERELWAQHQVSWCERLGVAREHVVFRRGFVHEVLKLDSPSEVLRDHPVETLHLRTGYSGQIPEDMPQRWLRWTEALRPRALHVNVSLSSAYDALLRPLFGCEALAGVQKLNVSIYSSGSFPTDSLLDALTRLGPALQTLVWNVTSISEEVLAGFLKAPLCRSLQELGLSSGSSSAVEAALLGCALPLTRLHLSNPPQDSRLRRWPSLARLEQLSLYQAGRVLPDMPGLLGACPQLAHLALAGFVRLNERLPSLAAFSNLRHLYLRENRLSSEDIVALFEGDWCSELRQLQLPGSYLREGRAFEHLGRVLQRVEALDISHTGIEERGVLELVQHGALRHLRDLQLPKVSASALQAIAEGAPSLRSLRVRGLDMPALHVLLGELAGRLRELALGKDTPDEQLALLASAPFPRLRTVTLSGTVEGLARLQSASWFAGLQHATLYPSSPG